MSVRILGSFISEIVVTTSELIFPLSFTYSPNTLINISIEFILSSFAELGSLIKSISASKKGVDFNILFIEHLCFPSIKTLTVPSGSFNNCKIFPIVPVWYKSFCSGSSTDDFF